MSDLSQAVLEILPYIFIIEQGLPGHLMQMYANDPWIYAKKQRQACPSLSCKQALLSYFKISCAKKSLETRVHTVWFHFYGLRIGKIKLG